MQTKPFHIPLPGTPTRVAAGYQISLSLLSTGLVYGTGTNTWSELCFQDYVPRKTWVKLPWSNITSIAVGRQHSLFILSNGTVIAMWR
jgi:alpha-tubulin suppressor-like RCC1 family protein